MTLHPDIYTASPLTSPDKSLRNTIMFTEHVLHAPLSRVEAPMCGQVPYPTFLMENRNQMLQQPPLLSVPLLERQYRTRMSVSSHTMAAKDKNIDETNACPSRDEERRMTASVESSTDSFSDGTVSSTNKRE